jgi:ribosomal protein S18 acetylase RimI-like enzyme
MAAARHNGLVVEESAVEPGAVTIRPVVPHEQEAVGRLTVAAYRTLPERRTAAHRAYEATMRDVAGRMRHSTVLVAVAEGQVVGTVTYVLAPGPDAETDDPEAAEIRMLAVDASARGRGIGQGLVEACITRARRDGRHRVVLHTRDVMEHGRRIYDRLGFRREPALDFHVDGIELLGYVLELT